MEINGKCILTGVPSEVLHQEDFYWIRNEFFDYAIDEETYQIFKHHTPPSLLVSNAMSEVIKANDQKIRVVWQYNRSKSTEPSGIRKAVFKYFEDFESDVPQHSEKPDLLLSRFAKKERILGPFQSLSFSLRDMYACKILSKDELREWVYQLTDEQIFETSKSVNFDPFTNNIKITPKGWRHVEQILKSFTSNKTFIAMSFSLPEREKVQDSIERACRDNGFEGQTVDRQEFNGAITDKIIAMINSAHFVVCDFSESKHGVYYEAGYAEGLGKTVIYCVRTEDVANLHFDTRHLNHIVWSSSEELYEKLFYRIKAIFVKTN